MDQFFLILNSVKDALLILLSYWWIYLPILLLIAFWEAFQNLNHIKYISSLKWVLLEIKVPKDVHKSPKGMEQVFSALHAAGLPPLFKEKYFKGKVKDWFSLEVLGRGGEIHFYIRTLEQYRNLVESQIYAQFADAEISEVEDYINEWPTTAPSNQYDLTGGEFILTKPDAFPIRTYPEFEESGGGKEDVKRIDPLASLAETLSVLKNGEDMAVQILIRNTGDGWVKAGQGAIDKLMGKEPKMESDFFSDFIFQIDKLLPGSSGIEKKEEKKDSSFVQLNPGKQEAIKAIERSFSKLGFQTAIRFMYIAPKDKFVRSHLTGIIGAFKQFSSQSLNGFKPANLTFATGLFKNQKVYSKKAHLFELMRFRTFIHDGFVLNTEELATVFHFPDIGVKTPFLPRIEAKKGEPPSELPIV